MKKLLFLFAYLSLVFVASAQVGINSDNSTPDPSAMLDVKSNSRGFLPPRMTHAEIEAIASPVDGLIVYCTDCDPEGGGAFFGYLNGYWAALSVCVPPARPGTGNHQADNDEIIWSWTGVPGAAGYRWNTVNSYPTAIDMGTALSKAESGLSSNTTYTRYVWAYNVCGSSLPQVLTASTTSAPMSVSIVSSANPVCAGSQVTYTATVVNGGASPTYNWYVNGVMQDDHGAVHVMAPDSFFDIFLEVFNGSGFITGDHAVSNTIHQVVTSVLPLSASIVSSANPSCAGSQVTFTSIVVNGGTNPVYNWYVNGVMQDDHSPVHVMAPDSFFDIFLEIFASPGMGCISGSPAVSNTIHQTVNPVLPLSASIVSSANPSCAGSQVTFTSTVVNGGSNPVYNWYVNGVMQGDHGPVHVMAPDSFFDIFLEIFASPGMGCISGSPAVSTTIHQVVNPVLPLSASIVSSANPSCAGSQVTFTSTVVNGGTNPVYNWYVNGVMQDDHSPVHVMAPDSFFDIFLEIFASPGMGCISGSPAVSNTIHQTVNPVFPLSASIVSSANPSCAGSQVTFTSTVVNGGTNPVYNWYVNGVMQDDHSPVHVMAPDSFFDIYLEIFASPGLGCISGSPAVSTTIQQVVNPVLPLSASIVSSANPSCAGSQVTFTSTVVNGGTNPVYNWYVNGVMQDDHSPIHVMAPDSFFDIFLEIFASPGMGCISGSPAVSNTISQAVTILPVTPVEGVHIPGTTQVQWNWNTVTGATGYKWSTTNNYLAATDLGTSATYTETGLTCNTVYTRYAWAYNICGQSQPILLTQSTSACPFVCGQNLVINHVAGAVAPVDKTTTYGTVTGIAGEPSKCWITSNLGSDHQATAVNDATEASAGWYWQFNRQQGYKHDGTTRTPNAAWIGNISENSDWLTANDPCSHEVGSAWRLPTYSEWYNIENTGGWTSWNGPWASGLKLHAAGLLNTSAGSLYGRGAGAWYWSRSQFSVGLGWFLTFSSGDSGMDYSGKATGLSARCLRN